jgi:glutathione peroxidase-family protein
LFFAKDDKGIIIVGQVASECSFTDSHYEALVGIQSKLNKGNRNIFQVLAFPSNQFGNQEPKVNMFLISIFYSIEYR